VTLLLEARDVSLGYGPALVVRDLNLSVGAGEVVALLGPNGAGKSTVIKALAGELAPASGEVRWDGHVSSAPLHKRARQGLSYVSEERTVFTQLTVRQNLAVGRDCDAERAVSLFPDLRGLMGRRGGLLSGGEQQQLTLGRALARPIRLLMADEITLGLAPKTARLLLAAIRAAADGGLGALVVEQHVHRALDIADRVYVLVRGRVQFEADAAEARSRITEIQDLYMSASTSGADCIDTAARGGSNGQ
jgi:ABC-type branched-subunit amino acid transport system ATPase component